MNISSANSTQGERYGVRRGCRHLKEHIRLEDYASELTELRGNGENLRGPCPVHGGDNPTAFTVTTSKGLWHCHACGLGGDVIDLCKLVEGHDKVWTAMLSLAQRYDIELPSRPQSWHRHKARQNRIRDGVRTSIARSYQRRLFRTFGGFLESIEHEETRHREAKEFWRDLWPVALYAADERMGVR